MSSVKVSTIFDSNQFLVRLRKDLEELKVILQSESDKELSYIEEKVLHASGLTTLEPSHTFNVQEFPPLNPPRPNIQDLRYMSVYAAAAYCSKLKSKHFHCNHCIQLGTNVEFIDSFGDFITDSFGYLAVDHLNQNIVLTFKGSANVKNWIMDSSFVPTPYKDAGIHSYVHTGFMHCVDTLKLTFIPKVQHIYSQYVNYNILVVGHSLGGAMATLSLVELKLTLNIPWSVFKLYTFGEPRAGNTFFATWLNHYLLNQFRVVNEQDIIPNLPFKKLGYSHHQQEITLQRVDLHGTSSFKKNSDNSKSGARSLNLEILDHAVYLDTVMGLSC